MSKIQHITGENYLTAEELLKQRLNDPECEAVMVVQLCPNNQITTYMSSGFTRMQAVYGARELWFEVEHLAFVEEEDD